MVKTNEHCFCDSPLRVFYIVFYARSQLFEDILKKLLELNGENRCLNQLSGVSSRFFFSFFRNFQRIQDFRRIRDVFLRSAQEIEDWDELFKKGRLDLVTFVRN